MFTHSGYFCIVKTTARTVRTVVAFNLIITDYLLRLKYSRLV